MKRLLALASTCLPIYLFAQGFGSFTQDQPYFSGSVPQSIGPYSLSNDTALTFWLNPRTLGGSGNITVWQDSIRGERFIPDGAPAPYYNATTNAVDNTAAFGLTVTNLNGTVRGFSLSTNNCNAWAYGVIVRIDPATSANRKGMWTSSNYVSTAQGALDDGASVQFHYPQFSGGLQYVVPTLTWFDLVILQQQSTNGGGTSYHFTNGVFAASASGASFSAWTNLGGVHPLLKLGTGPGQQNGFAGQWRDFVIWTNIDLANITNRSTNFHFFRTNVYGP